MDLRRTFDHQALLYDKARPHYPPELYDTLIKTTGIQPPDPLLEIGPGTGQATQPLAARGFRITGVELGEHLAVVARHKLRNYPNVEIITGSFEKTEFPPVSFKLIYSATAFHWIKPEVRFAKTHQLLRPGGHLAVIHTNHVSDEQGDAFHAASAPIYNKYWPPGKKPSNPPQTSELGPPNIDEALYRHVYFGVFPLTTEYTADQYVELLGTYSPTLALPPAKQKAFLQEIKTLINTKFNGHHTKHFAMSLAILRSVGDKF